MRTAAKILAGVGLLLMIVIIGVAIAVSTMDVNTLIGPVAARVKNATGRDLAVRGAADIELSLQPRLVLNDVTLSNARWASAPQMVSAKRLELKVALLPLLSRRLELVEITLVGPVITLETDAKGARNWDFALAAEPATPAAPASRSMPMAVGNIAVSEGSVTYRDGVTGAITHVLVDRLFVRVRDPQAPIVAQFHGKVDDVAVAVEGTLGPLESLLERRWPFPLTLKGDVAGRNITFRANLRGGEKSYALEALQATVGTSSVTGSFAVRMDDPRPKLVFDLTSPVLGLADIPFPAAGERGPQAASTVASKAGAARVFSDLPVNFALLRLVDAEGSVVIGRLLLRDGRQIDDVRIQIALGNGRLNVPSFAAKLFGGSVAGSLAIDASAIGNPSLVVRMSGTGLDLGAVLAAMGRPRDVKGGIADASANLTMRGNSPHQWASTASGTFRAVVGRATILNSKLEFDSTIDRLTDAVNPFRKTDASTDLMCAVVRLPLTNGVAKVDRAIAMETGKLGVSASGTLDFRNETLDFSIKPQLRKGIPIEIPRLASLVRLSGPFTSPQIKVDPVASAAAIATIGAAISSGGLSAVGQTLFAMTTEGSAGPCQVALSQAGPAPAATSSDSHAREAMPLAEEIGKALGGLFKR